MLSALRASAPMTPGRAARGGALCALQGGKARARHGSDVLGVRTRGRDREAAQALDLGVELPGKLAPSRSAALEAEVDVQGAIQRVHVGPADDVGAVGE